MKAEEYIKNNSHQPGEERERGKERGERGRERTDWLPDTYSLGLF